MTFVELNGEMVDFDAVVNMMDDEIREDLHRTISPCTPQEFIDAYCVEHDEKFGETFDI